MHLRFTGKSLFVILTCIRTLFPGNLSAQQTTVDTLTLTIPQAEEIFLKKNLTLLANQYNVDINKALVQQAKVWDNPVLLTDQNIYDGKFFRHKTENGQQYGQVYLQVQQLIKTAGKIKKQTQLAQDNVLSAEAQFNDVMRNLKYVLSTDFNNLAQLQHIASVYQDEIQTMQSLAKGMDAMLSLGDVSRKDNIRIKALLFSLQSDYNNNLKQQYDLQQEIATLLQQDKNTWILADASQSFDETNISGLNIAALQDSALLLRPDLAFARNQSVFGQHNIAYQKALAKPDVTAGIEYDKLNSYTPNYYGLSLSVPLPIFNRNRGNIIAAEYALKQSSAVVSELQLRVNNEVAAAWQKLFNTTKMLNNDNAQLQDNYNQLLKNMVDSYRQRQVSLIEFIDFFDAYKETRIKQGQLVNDQRNAAAELNYTTNQDIIKL